MTEQEQRISIAEACPNILCKFFDEDERERLWHYIACGVWHKCKENDPLQDLNAMHEAERYHILVDVDTALAYSKWLQECGVCFDFHATAAQRAEAFLRTLNLWKD